MQQHFLPVEEEGEQFGRADECERQPDSFPVPLSAPPCAPQPAGPFARIERHGLPRWKPCALRALLNRPVDLPLSARRRRRRADWDPSAVALFCLIAYASLTLCPEETNSEPQSVRNRFKVGPPCAFNRATVSVDGWAPRKTSTPRRTRRWGCAIRGKLRERVTRVPGASYARAECQRA
jgi:hypothetical protein